jgi:ribosome maturation factor RimP
LPTLFCEKLGGYTLSKLTEKVAALAAPIVEEEGCSLWDVEYVKEAGTWFLRIFIDREDGVSIDDCERISRRLDPVLDEEDPIPDSYVFEVGSAGADRVLKRPSDFTQFMGSMVEVSLYQPVNGSKRYVGELNGYQDGAVILLQGKTITRFSKEQIAQVRLYVSFD